MYPINIDFWFIQVRGYEGHWALGILLMGFFYQKYKSLKAGYDKEWFINAYAFAIFVGIIFARAFHFFFWETDEFLNNPLILFRPSGGFAILGGTIGTGLGGWIYCLITKKNFLHWCDSLMTPLTLGLCLSRLSCFLNGDAYGSPTDSIFGVVFSENSDDWMYHWNSLHNLYAYSEKPLNVISNLFLGQVNLSSIPLPNVLEPLKSEGIENLAQLSKFYPPVATGDYISILKEKGLFPFPVIYPPVHPTQLYELFILGIGFLILFKLEDVAWAQRKLFFVFWIIYGFNRYFIEMFRGDRNVFIGNLTYAQVISVFLCIGGVVGILFFTWKWKKYGMPIVNPKS
ncbi:MAG: prolipoprotein diacylglyceryl transferase [Leptospira sp.]|nr:prolipoprotein diacylglyceryl transferase [Leptospira sp.]